MTKELVGVSKRTGDLLSLIPLYSMQEPMELAIGYSITVFHHIEKPLAYILFIDSTDNGTVFGADIVHKYVEVLGEL